MIITLARHAMATRFEFVLCGSPAGGRDDEGFMRAVGEEALDEIERIEAQLSFFSDASEVTDLNRNAARAAVKVDPRVFRLLQSARRLSEATAGSFDVTVAPLLRLWGLRGEPPSAPPTNSEIEAALQVVGFGNVELDEENFTVRFRREGVTIDLGGIGKGYAIDRAAQIVREAGITSALLHGGTSSVCAIGAPPDADAWKIAIHNPLAVSPASPVPPYPPRSLAVAHLRDLSLSISAQHGRGVVIGGKRYGHTVDPTTGHPVEGALLAAVVCESATDADALSTALLIAGSDDVIPSECSCLAVFADVDGEVVLRMSGPSFSAGPSSCSP